MRGVHLLAVFVGAGLLPEFQTFRHQPGDSNSLDTDFINALYEDRQGTARD